MGRSGTALAILALILAYAYLLATLTEFHTNQWRRRLESKLHVH